MQQEQSSGSAVGDKVDQATEVISARKDDAVEKGRSALQQQVGQRSAQLSDQVGSASQTIRRVADQARMDGNDQQARMAEQAADRADRLSSYLIDVDPERLMNDAEDFARRQPWLVAGVGLFAGFVVARSLKASSSRRSNARYGVDYGVGDGLANGRTSQQPYTMPDIGSGAVS
jgi:ElaB/YqjD/DUF883 family membrane-anchored ribosome-binding protein